MSTMGRVIRVVGAGGDDWAGRFVVGGGVWRCFVWHGRVVCSLGFFGGLGRCGHGGRVSSLHTGTWCARGSGGVIGYDDDGHGSVVKDAVHG